MPNYKQHLLGGCAAYGLAMLAASSTCTLSCVTASEWLACTLAGSLFPDIDIKSKGQKLFYSLFLVTTFVLVITNELQTAALLSILGCVPLLVRHRGIFHDLWFIIALSSISTALLSRYIVSSCPVNVWLHTLFFNAGAFSHLVLDKGLKKTLVVPEYFQL